MLTLCIRWGHKQPCPGIISLCSECRTARTSQIGAVEEFDKVQILEGFALGIQENITGIVTLFISLLFDKGIEAFSVGLQISRSNRKRVMFVVITIITYALMTPVGAMIGVALQVTVSFVYLI